MFNAINEVWEATHGEEEVQLVGMKVSDELALEFECYDGHLTIEDWDGNWIEIDEHNTIIDTGCLGM